MAKPEIIHHLPLKKVLEISRAFKNSNEPSFAHPHPQYFRFFSFITFILVVVVYQLSSFRSFLPNRLDGRREALLYVESVHHP